MSAQPMYIDRGVTAGASYSYRIEAADVFGNVSDKSSAASATAK